MRVGLHRLIHDFDERSGVQAIAFWGVFLAVVQIGAIALSVAGLTIGRLAAWAILVFALAAGYVAGRALRRDTSPEAGAGGEPPALSKLAKLIFLAAALTVVFLAVLAWVGEDRTMDGNDYHLPAVHFWMLEGRVHWIDPGFLSSSRMNGYPKTAEVVAFIAATAIDGSVANALNLFFLPLGVCGAFVLARALGATRLASAMAGAAWTLVPVCIGQAPTTLVDSALASSVVGFLAVLAWLLAARGTPAVPALWRLLPATAALFALVVGVKSTGPAIAGLGILSFAGVLFFRARSDASAPARPWPWLGFLLAAVLLGSVVGGWWYARNWAHTGVPLYPVDSRDNLQRTTVLLSTPPTLGRMAEPLRAPYVWMQVGQEGERWPLTILSGDNRFGGLGFLWLFGGLPAILVMGWVCLFRRHDRAAVFAFLFIAVSAAFVVVPAPWHPRFVVWVHGLGLACFAAVLGASKAGDGAPCRPLGRLGRAWLGIVVVATLIEAALALGFTALYTLAPPVDLHALYHEGRLSELRGRTDWLAAGYAKCDLRGTLVQEALHDGRPMAWDRTAVPPDIGAFARPLGRRVIVPLPKPTDAAALARLRSAGVVWVVLGPDVPLPEMLRPRVLREERTSTLHVAEISP